jgi:hypothetical protein
MRSACFSALGRAVLPWLLVFASGCSSEKDGVEKQLSKLEEQVRHLQSETDRMGERLDAVESRKIAVAHEPEERVATNSNTISRPKLKVVRMEPGDEGVVDDAPETTASAPDDDTGPRVVIQGEGKSVESRQLAGSAPPAAKTTKPESSKARKSDAAKSDAAPSK